MMDRFSLLLRKESLTPKLAIRFACKGAPTLNIEAGSPAWARIEPEGWVEATAISATGTTIPSDAKLFDTEEECHAFMKRWKGHPWYFEHNGSYEIIAVEPQFRMEPIFMGYKFLDVVSTKEKKCKSK